MLAKCANPCCPARFNHRGGGKFFRFRRQPEPTEMPDPGQDPADGSHNVVHFWLCARCCQILTLAYMEGPGVVLVWSGEGIPAAPSMQQLSAA